MCVCVCDSSVALIGCNAPRGAARGRLTCDSYSKCKLWDVNGIVSVTESERERKAGSEKEWMREGKGDGERKRERERRTAAGTGIWVRPCDVTRPKTWLSCPHLHTNAAHTHNRHTHTHSPHTATVWLSLTAAAARAKPGEPQRQLCKILSLKLIKKEPEAQNIYTHTDTHIPLLTQTPLSSLSPYTHTHTHTVTH